MANTWNTGYPEDNGEYLITWTCDPRGDGSLFRGISIAEFQGIDYDTEDGLANIDESEYWILEDYLKVYKSIKVIAWMELPKPFEEEV